MVHPTSKEELKLLEEPNIEHNNDDEIQKESSRKDEMEVEEEHADEGISKRT